MTDSEAGRLLGIVVYVAGVLIALAGFLVLCYQGILWLQHGYWTQFAMREVVSILSGGAPISNPTLQWQGIQKVIVWLLDAPLSFGSIIVGIATVFAGAAIVGSAED
jgi:hypothetical protein